MDYGITGRLLSPISHIWKNSKRANETCQKHRNGGVASHPNRYERKSSIGIFNLLYAKFEN